MHLADALSKATHKAIPAILFFSSTLPITNKFQFFFCSMEYTTIKKLYPELMHIEQYG